MSSAWGGSWGSAWGDSWGTISQPVRNPPQSGGSGGHIGSRWKRKRVSEETALWKGGSPAKILEAKASKKVAIVAAAPKPPIPAALAKLLTPAILLPGPTALPSAASDDPSDEDLAVIFSFLH